PRSLRLRPSGPGRIGECSGRRQPPNLVYQNRSPPKQGRQQSPIMLASYAAPFTVAGMIPFSGNPLDRAGNRRGDTAWLASARASTRARVLPLWKLQPLLFSPQGVPETCAHLGFIDGTLASGLGGADAIEVFLGLQGEEAFFTRDISALPDPLAAALANYGHFRDARSATGLLDSGESAILAQAKAMIDWHSRHRFCAHCGQPTSLSDAGYCRVRAQCRA